MGGPVLQDDLSSDEEYGKDDDLFTPVEGLTPTIKGDEDKTPTMPSNSVVGGLAKFFPVKRAQSYMGSCDSTPSTDFSPSPPGSQKSVGWDMNPCVVISFGEKVFRTRVIHQTVDPTQDEQLIFHSQNLLPIVWI